MGMKVGLWIDHRKAIIVKLTEQGEKIESINSGVEKQLRRSSDNPLKGPFDVLHVPKDTTRQRIFTGYLNAYYDTIIASLQPAQAILIMGPSEAKEELEKQMDKFGLGKNVVGVEAAGRMTERQIAARVKRFFED